MRGLVTNTSYKLQVIKREETFFFLSSKYATGESASREEACKFGKAVFLALLIYHTACFFMT